jgi:hypothetical protein
MMFPFGFPSSPTDFPANDWFENEHKTPGQRIHMNGLGGAGTWLATNVAAAEFNFINLVAFHNLKEIWFRVLALEGLQRCTPTQVQKFQD